MATQTLEFNATQGLTLTAKLFALGSDTVVQSVSATAKTNDKGRYTAAFTDLPIGRYRLNAFVGTNGGFANETYKVVSIVTAKYFPDSEQQESLYPPVERPTDDTAVIEFYWPIASATFANSASTCKRRFLGETGAQEEALSGAISAISGKAGWYKIAYALADRAADAATVIPTSVTYTLVDDSGNSGELTLKIVALSDTTDLEAAIDALAASSNVTSPSQADTTAGQFYIHAGVDFDEDFDVTIPSGWDKVLFTIKDGRELDESGDANSILQLQVSNRSSGSDGVLYLNREAAADASLGSIDVAVGLDAITVTLNAELTSQLRTGKTYNWDIAVINGTAKPYVSSPGTVNIKDVVTRTLP